MSHIANIIWKCVGISVAAAILIGAVVWGYMMKPSSVPCAGLRYIIEDRDQRLYLTEGELDELLQAENLYPVDKAIDKLSLYRIEHAVAAHPMVRTAECYLTPQNEMRVQITQRVPLLRVQTPGDTYFIDTDRRVMPVRASVKDSVLLVSGAVGVQTASGELANMALWLQDQPYWRTRVQCVHMQTPRKVYVYLQGQNQPRVLLGVLGGYARKFAKLRTFFENGAEAIQDKQYYELDLQYKGQVIGRY